MPRTVNGTGQRVRESRGFNVGEVCFIALPSRRFARSRLRRGVRPYCKSQARAPTASAARKKRNARVSTRLAYSTTSSSAEDNLLARGAQPSKRGSQKSCERSYRQPSKGSERTRRPQRPPCRRTPQRARGSLSSARDRGAPRRRRDALRGDHKTPGGHHKQG